MTPPPSTDPGVSADRTSLASMRRVFPSCNVLRKNSEAEHMSGSVFSYIAHAVVVQVKVMVIGRDFQECTTAALTAHVFTIKRREPELPVAPQYQSM